MNHRMIAYVTGRILLVVGLLMSPTLLVSFYYREEAEVHIAIFAALALTCAVGFVLSMHRPHNQRFYLREGFVITALCWIMLSIAGALPFFITGALPSFVDALFESASGFTTTGSTVLTDIEALPHSLLFWRSFTHFIGGMGVLVFALAVLPDSGSQNVHLMRAETTGPSFGKLVSRLRTTARLLYTIYAVMTVVLFLVLMLCGMTPFDAIIHAFGTAGTGGFSNYNDSIAHFHSGLIEVVLGVAMIAFGINFTLYYVAIRGHWRTLWHNEILRYYLGIIVLAMIAIFMNIRPSYESALQCLRDVFFIVSSIITTTGFGTADFNQWPLFSKMILLLLMVCGSCAGSTAGGAKVDRIVRALKIMRAQILTTANPRRMQPVMVSGKPINEPERRHIATFFLLYGGVFFGMLLLVSLDHLNLETALTAVLTAMNNVGPGLDGIGPTSNFAGLSDLSKLTLVFGMIAGRLELMPMMILLSPVAWRRH